MMFKFITDTAQAAVDLTLDTADFVTGGEAPKRKDIAQLLAAGMTVAAIAAATGVAVDVIEEMTND